MFVEIAVNLPPVRGTFDYHLPPELRQVVQPGHLVTAPFGDRQVQGVVIRRMNQAAVEETRPIDDLLDEEPVLTGAQLTLAEWLQARSRSPLIDCLTLMLPPGLSQRADMLYRLQTDPDDDLSATQARLAGLLRKRGPLRGRQIERAMGRATWRPSMQALVRKGWVQSNSVLDPPRVSARQVRTVRLAVSPEQALISERELGSTTATRTRRRAVLDTLIREREPLQVNWVYAESGAKWSDLRRLEALDLIALSSAEVWRDPLEEVDFVPADPPELTPDQSQVWRTLQASLRAERGKPFLLHGVTGSGKTELYLRAAGEVMAQGRQAIVLVPEIALTPQTVRRFLARFPGRVGLIHSQLSEGERYDTWRRARQGLIQVLIGPRSALFTPLPAIGLIVLDESHDDSYKELQGHPRYHARETALAYAQILGATTILGSATPDVVTTYRAERGKLTRLSLPKRILGHQQKVQDQAARLGIRSRYQAYGDAQAATIDLPPVRIIDMRQELMAGNRSLLSRALQQALEKTLAMNQQAILLLNRRGSASYVFCRDCGHALTCTNCDNPLTYHSARERLVCHHCNNTRQLPERCPQCNSTRIKHFGAGTQRLQETIEAQFPGARTLRWDRDATRAKGAHDVILSHFIARRADVLIGTQMVAKGLDLPLVTLVGVVSADLGLNLPDYTAPERSFQLLTQVAGRAGRSLLGGLVILQTYQPDHYAIQAAAGHDYEAFYRQEIRLRRELGYPPFTRLARLVYRHHQQAAAERETRRLATEIQARIRSLALQAELIGPAPCFYRRLNRQHRWQIVIRATDPTPLIPDDLPRGWTIDVDPVSLL